MKLTKKRYKEIKTHSQKGKEEYQESLEFLLIYFCDEVRQGSLSRPEMLPFISRVARQYYEKYSK